MLLDMEHLTVLSKSQLIEVLNENEQQHAVELETCVVQIQSQTTQLETQTAQLETQTSELRARDIQRQEQDQKLEKLSQEYTELQLAYNKLLQRQFGNRSERYIDDPDQLRLDFGDTDEAADAASGLAEAVDEFEETTVPEHKRRKRKRKQEKGLPEHLPRYEVTTEVPDEAKNCPEHGERTLLPESMWDRTESLEFERPKLKVRVTLYPKYVCDGQPQCGVGSPERPTSIVEGDKYSSSIAAEIITGKYGYHLPLYRLQDYFAGCGWVPSRSTQCNILTQVHFVIEPLLESFKAQVQRDSIIGCDDTSVTLLYSKTIPPLDLDDPKERRIHEVLTKAAGEKKPSIQAKMWAYRGVTVPLNVFDFTVSRHRDGPELFFADYEGTLLGDCWSGFESIVVASGGSIKRAACNSHARRKFEESTAYPDERRLWLCWYQALYDIEDRGKTMSVEERVALRQSEAVPIWNEIEAWLKSVKERTSNVILPKSDLAKALQYVRNHFEELRRYLDDGRMPMDNNETEQLMRQVAVGRKNWLFTGSIAGGERTAGFMTLVSSALRNNLDVWAYIKDVLDQLLAGRTDYEPLLPWNWAEQHPEAIRQYRLSERQAKRDRQRAKRANRRNKNGRS